MRLPEELHERRFADWNHVVKGLMEAWNLAKLLGMDDHLEQQLLRDHDGAVTELLARIGNDCAALRALLRARSPSSAWEGQEPILFAITVGADDPGESGLHPAPQALRDGDMDGAGGGPWKSGSARDAEETGEGLREVPPLRSRRRIRSLPLCY
jgi:hypothetical protein